MHISSSEDKDRLFRLAGAGQGAGGLSAPADHPPATRPAQRPNGRVKASKPTGGMKRVSVYIPEQLYLDLQDFADQRGDTVGGVLRWCMGVGKVIWDQISDGYVIHSTPTEPGDRRELVFNRF